MATKDKCNKSWTFPQKPMQLRRKALDKYITTSTNWVCTKKERKKKSVTICLWRNCHVWQHSSAVTTSHIFKKGLTGIQSDSQVAKKGFGNSEVPLPMWSFSLISPEEKKRLTHSQYEPYRAFDSVSAPTQMIRAKPYCNFILILFTEIFLLFASLSTWVPHAKMWIQFYYFLHLVWKWQNLCCW